MPHTPLVVVHCCCCYCCDDDDENAGDDDDDDDDNDNDDENDDDDDDDAGTDSAQALGAGRSHPADKLDLAAGVELMVEPGDLVREGEVWAVVHHNREVPGHLLKGTVQ